MPPPITIIVAVYRAEAYFHYCMQSLLNQTFRNFEILLIDDGSPDNSGRICDEYAKKDARIRVFHKENGGVSSARQCGIDNAFGEYTIHVDPDDWIEPDMLEKLYKRAQKDNADMVFCDFYLEYKDKTKYENQQPSGLSNRSILFDLLVYYKQRVSLCNRLIRLSCYRNHGIYFPQELKYGEDNCVLIRLICQMKTISYLPQAYYHYNLYSNLNSLTRREKKDIVAVRTTRFNYYKDDLYQTSPKLYNACLSATAYEFFADNLFSASEYKEKYRNKIILFLCSPISIKMKSFIIFSALGYKDIAYRIYNKLKRIFPNKNKLSKLEDI